MHITACKSSNCCIDISNSQCNCRSNSSNNKYRTICNKCSRCIGNVSRRYQLRAPLPIPVMPFQASFGSDDNSARRAMTQFDTQQLPHKRNSLRQDLLSHLRAQSAPVPLTSVCLMPTPMPTHLSMPHRSNFEFEAPHSSGAAMSFGLAAKVSDAAAAITTTRQAVSNNLHCIPSP